MKKSKTKIKLKPAQNGYIVEIYGEKYVFKDGEIKDMLYHIRDMISAGGSRYSKRRIYITIAHGDKYECSDKDCVLCRRLNALYEEHPDDDKPLDEI